MLDTGIVPGYQHIMADNHSNSILAEMPEPSVGELAALVRRVMLAALVGEGRTKYIVRDITLAEIDDATDAEINVMYARYKSKLRMEIYNFYIEMDKLYPDDEIERRVAPAVKVEEGSADEAASQVRRGKIAALVAEQSASFFTYNLMAFLTDLRE